MLWMLVTVNKLKHISCRVPHTSWIIIEGTTFTQALFSMSSGISPALLTLIFGKNELSIANFCQSISKQAREGGREKHKQFKIFFVTRKCKNVISQLLLSTLKYCIWQKISEEINNCSSLVKKALDICYLKWMPLLSWMYCNLERVNYCWSRHYFDYIFLLFPFWSLSSIAGEKYVVSAREFETMSFETSYQKFPCQFPRNQWRLYWIW